MSTRTRKTKRQLEEEAAAEIARLAREEEEKAAAAARAAEEAIQLAKLEADRAAAAEAARLLSLHPIETPNSIYFDEIISFCMPDAEIYPRSRGRLFFLESAGPLSHRHNLACLCGNCKEKVTNLRKSNNSAKLIWEGTQFTRGNLKKFKENSLSNSLETLKLSETSLAKTVEISAQTNEENFANLQAALAAAIPPSETSSIQPIRPPPACSRLLDSEFPFELCRACRSHVKFEPHLLSGNRGSLIVKPQQIDESALEFENRELLLAYKCSPTLSLVDQREFLSKLDAEKREKAHRPINRRQLMKLLRKAKLFNNGEEKNGNNEEKEEKPKKSNSHRSTESNPFMESEFDEIPHLLLDFNSVRSLIKEYRLNERKNLGNMYQDVVSKVWKGPPNPHDHVKMTRLLSEIPPIEYKLTKEWIQKSRNSGEKKSSETPPRIPDYAVIRLNDRLLHRFSHEIVDLKEMKTPALVNNVHIMRNSLQSNERMGWKT